jgi:Recombination endonuclease VII
VPYADRKRKWLREKERIASDPVYAAKVRNRTKAAMRARRKKFPESVWKSRGMPVPTRTRPEVCELCNRTKKLVNDHDHVSGKFRGWLCTGCNVGLGLLGDTAEKIEAALAYIKRSA